MWMTIQTYFIGLATRWTSLGTSFRDWLTRRSIDGDHIVDVITSAAVLPVLAALSVCAVWTRGDVHCTRARVAMGTDNASDRRCRGDRVHLDL